MRNGDRKHRKKDMEEGKPTFMKDRKLQDSPHKEHIYFISFMSDDCLSVFY